MRNKINYKDLYYIIKSILDSKIVCDENHASLKDIYSLSERVCIKNEIELQNHKDKIVKKLSQAYRMNCDIHVAFDYSKEELSCTLIDPGITKLGLVSSMYAPAYKFIKDDQFNLCVSKPASETFFNGEEFLSLIKSELSDLYDFYLEIKDTYQKISTNIEIKDTPFLADILDLSVCLSTKELYPEGRFFLFYDIEKKRYELKCDSPKIRRLLKRKEAAFFGNILIEIESCPDWMLPYLKEEKIMNEKNMILKQTPN